MKCASAILKSFNYNLDNIGICLVKHEFVLPISENSLMRRKEKVNWMMMVNYPEVERSGQVQ